MACGCCGVHRPFDCCERLQQRDAARARGVIDGAQRVLDRPVNVPVDIEPRFVTAAALAGR